MESSWLAAGAVEQAVDDDLPRSDHRRQDRGHDDGHRAEHDAGLPPARVPANYSKFGLGFDGGPVPTQSFFARTNAAMIADPTMAALKAIREIAGHERPRRGCQEGLCGKCESKVNGQDTRLCITPIGSLMGAVVATPAARKSIWG